MKTEKIGDVLQGMDVSSEDAIVTLSDRIWEIGSIDEIKKQVSDAAFTFHVVTNVIGNCKGDGWQSIIENNADLLPYISSAMYEIGLDNVGEATKTLNICRIFPLDISTLNSKDFCKVINFMKGHATDLEVLKKYSETEHEEMSKEYFTTINKLDDMAAKIWNYGCPDNEGWGVVSRYLEKHLQDNLMCKIKEDKLINELDGNIYKAISNLSDRDLSLSNVIEYIDYINKVRYTEDEIIKGLIRLIKEHSNRSC